MLPFLLSLLFSGVAPAAGPTPWELRSVPAWESGSQVAAPIAQARGRARGWNVDFGEAERPPAEYGGEAQQGGYWNGVGYTRQSQWPLRDVDGLETEVTLSLSGAASWVQCLEGGRLGPLLRDGVHASGDDLIVRWNQLPPGDYALFVYAKPNCQAQDTQIGVLGAEPAWQCQELDAQGQSPQAVAFRITTWEAPLEIIVRPGGARAEARLAGLQLVPLGGDVTQEAKVFFDHLGVRMQVVSVPGDVRHGLLSEPGRPVGLWSWGPWYGGAWPAAPIGGWESFAVGCRPSVPSDRAARLRNDWQWGADRSLVGMTVWGRVRARDAWSTWTAGRVQRWGLP